MPPDADFALIASSRRPTHHRADQPLQVPNVSFISRRDAGVSEFVRDDAEKVAFDRCGTEPDCFFLKVTKAIEPLLVGWTLHPDAPPLAVELEAHCRCGLLALTRGCGGLFHLSL